MRFFVRVTAAGVTAVAALVWPLVVAAGTDGHSAVFHSESLAPRGEAGRELEIDLATAELLYARPPVDARIDRVWHAVPGLCGWALDWPKSTALTTQEEDGFVHLVWHQLLPSRRLAQLPQEPVYRGPVGERSAALMFNVSWGEAELPQVLTILRQKGVHATFFLDGAWVKAHPELARDIARGGHDIGSHGTGHPDFRKLTEAQLSGQIYRTNSVIKQTVERDPRLLAPPAGAYDRRTVTTAARAGMHTILWSADSVDWMRPSPDRIVERVLRQTRPGALILMHPTAPTVTALPVLIDRLRAAGYQFKTVQAVIDEEPAVQAPAVLSLHE